MDGVALFDAAWRVVRGRDLCIEDGLRIPLSLSLAINRLSDAVETEDAAYRKAVLSAISSMRL